MDGDNDGKKEASPQSHTIYERDPKLIVNPAGMASRMQDFTPVITAADIQTDGATGSAGTTAGTNIFQSKTVVHAPQAQSVTTVVKAEHVMIGPGSIMNINVHPARPFDSETDESDSEEEELDLEKEVMKRRKREEEEDKKAMVRETLQSSRPITDEEIRNVSNRLLGAWRKFLRSLDMDDDTIQQYYNDYISSDGKLHEVVYQSLDHWRRTSDSPEVQKVAHALAKVNMLDVVADHLHP